jgi:hypothetical protein
VRLSSGAALARLRAEKAAPTFDVWFAGSGDSHWVAQAEGLTEFFRPKAWGELRAQLIYCFVRAVTAVSQVIFLVSPGHDLATVLLLSWAEYGHLGRGAALASVLVVFLAAVILPVERFGRRGSRLDPTAAT